MKKFLALLLALTMALALVACGGGDDAASDTTADSGDDAAASTGEFEEMTWKFALLRHGDLSLGGRRQGVRPDRGREDRRCHHRSVLSR